MFIHFKGNTMQWLTRLQVGQRLGLAFSLLVVLIIGVAITGFSGARSTFKQAETIYYDGALPLAEMGDMNYLVQRNRIATMDMLLRPEPTLRAIEAGNIAQAVSLAESVAAGDLTRRVHVQGRDELTKLLGSLNGMSENLARIVSDVRSSSENVATGSTQIAAGTIDLSQRTKGAEWRSAGSANGQPGG